MSSLSRTERLPWLIMHIYQVHAELYIFVCLPCLTDREPASRQTPNSHPPLPPDKTKKKKEKQRKETHTKTKQNKAIKHQNKNTKSRQRFGYVYKRRNCLHDGIWHISSVEGYCHRAVSFFPYRYIVPSEEC